MVSQVEPLLANSFERVFMGAAGSGGGATFTISPSVGGVSNWDMANDGDLILGHGQWTITLSNTFSVNIDMWGAGGPSGNSYTTSAGGAIGPGGGGGHTTADVILNDGWEYTIQVGEGGDRNWQGGPATTTYIAGGLRTSWGTEGGGYTGLFETNSGASPHQSNALLMAGGGGGGGDANYDGSGAGAGGGASGGNAGGGAQSGYGGTQSAGGAASVYNDCVAGSALYGGGGFSVYWYTYSSMGGGGGGYFGGGGGNVGGGGGGSGYIDTSDSDITNEVTTAGSFSTPGDSGNSRRNGAGQGGTGSGQSGTDGRFYMSAN